MLCASAIRRVVPTLEMLVITRPAQATAHYDNDTDPASGRLPNAGHDRLVRPDAQASEIIETQGIRLVGFLPGEFNLTTDYVAALSTASERLPAAIAYLKYLSGTDSAHLRNQAGFVLPQSTA